MAEPDEIVEWILDQFEMPPDLRGERLLVSAGPTQESLDPFRFISNPSSGRMGVAIAEAAARCGAQVTLVHGPLAVTPPRLSENIAIRTAAELYEAITSRFSDATGLMMSAAVADFTPEDVAEHKIKKTQAPQALKLNRTKDILAELSHIRQEQQIVVGFCAESQNIQESAMEKLHKKKLDAIVANNIVTPGQGFRSLFNEVTVFMKDGTSLGFDKMEKSRLALHLLRIYADIRSRKNAAQPVAS
jgi:phosphopantothenoylcysteine decarboxylase/phosphopantothenate--cysteine ligase